MSLYVTYIYTSFCHLLSGLQVCLCSVFALAYRQNLMQELLLTCSRREEMYSLILASFNTENSSSFWWCIIRETVRGQTRLHASNIFNGEKKELSNTENLRLLGMWSFSALYNYQVPCDFSDLCQSPHLGCFAPSRVSINWQLTHLSKHRTT